jgi:DNA-binding response OmpR family regulator
LSSTCGTSTPTFITPSGTVGTLRRKLAVDDEPQLIETVVGRGYKLRDDL